MNHFPIHNSHFTNGRKESQFTIPYFEESTHLYVEVGQFLKIGIMIPSACSWNEELWIGKRFIFYSFYESFNSNFGFNFSKMCQKWPRPRNRNCDSLRIGIGPPLISILDSCHLFDGRSELEVVWFRQWNQFWNRFLGIFWNSVIPFPIPTPFHKWVDSNLELIPVMQLIPVLESIPVVELFRYWNRFQQRVNSIWFQYQLLW